MLYEASKPFIRSCKGTGVYNKLENLHIGKFAYFFFHFIKLFGLMPNHRFKFNFIVFLTNPHFKFKCRDNFA